jgi:hypothetical protein
MVEYAFGILFESNILCVNNRYISSVNFPVSDTGIIKSLNCIMHPYNMGE